MWTAQFGAYTFFELFYVFVMYSFFGWALESVFVSATTKEWVNRGFINGPFCPIYGAGALLLTILLSPLQEHILLLFFGGCVIATLVEYVVAVILEKLFHASWWDYSNKKWNIKGRVCLLRSVQWGALTVVVIRWIHPFVERWIDRIPQMFGEIAGTVLMLYLIADAGITVQQILHLNEKLTRLAEVREEIRTKLESTKLYAARQDLAERLEKLPAAEWLREWKACMEENYADMEQMRLEEQLRAEYIRNEIREKLEYKIRAAEQANRGQRRLIRAFPKMRSLHFDAELQELRMQLEERRKKRKHSKGEKKEQ
ncbi:MAG TPA: hypothetical protein H9733_03790 [Candidatus Anaerotignum merdipullorum]|nr:hypothetical protein [Candidatus Anaerotignum merdipullorum]